ncbi:metallophosphoesterase [Cypionkella aquatica]|uniref:Metallophosphoesterase n=1 Tax=Cypionkella aquatica TaxID=1756042 RepID=A0AA37TX09_9RHOB|nr:metallophosphoesterase family protein [Cypionkella aquatica]GLS85096.1 metallophosphoesterase [Cypionkella aquatica]
MRLALLTDIHANREAFEAVLADLSQRQIDQLVFLGDIVGYGPDPGWCVDQLEALVAKGALALRGNHDRAVTTPDNVLNSNARRVIDWTVNRLNARQKLFLSELPLTIADGDTLFTHASANDPADWLYITTESTARPSFLVCDARLIFCGHTHRAALYSCDLAGRVGQINLAAGQTMPLLHSRRWLGVIGSVGQPRDGSTLASYAILDRDLNELSFRRVAYDATTTARKSREAGLPEALAQRLMKGI